MISARTRAETSMSRMTQCSIPRTLLPCALLVLLVPSIGLGFGDEGHEIIGAIAAHELTPGARARVLALLATDHSGLTADTSIPAEATWADRARDATTRGWHYVNLELHDPDLASACAGRESCIVTKIDEFRAELANPTTPAAERLRALQFLLHLVGDLHQPLHAADDRDRGGNTERVHAPGLPEGSLHHYWDTVFVAALGTDSTAVADRLLAEISPEDRRRWCAGTTSAWAWDSYAIARRRVYGELPRPDAGGRYQLDSQYVADAGAIERVQLERAGVRLGWLLNQLFGDRR
jgi:hypothetical protein